ncbi:HlyD family efflux transporter periplasmic adaptor subunit [Bacillus mycoides]|uniref:HlyD family efflux transporter periplasmic adaptor subunit n=1 Tax=Bacillus mycoides TaxID=1405 RepID=UPI003D65C98D
MSKMYSFDQLTDSVELLERKPPRFITSLLVFLLVSVVAFSIWVYVGKLDVVSKGTAIIEGKSDVSVSRTQVGGIVDMVLVQSGDEVKQGDTLVQLRNQDLMDKQNQMDHIVQHLGKQKGMLEQLKQSIQSHQIFFSNEVDPKIKEEYKAYEQNYQSLQREKENEIKTIENSRVTDKQDEVLQGLIAEKENVQREMQSIKKQSRKESLLEEQKQVLDDKMEFLESQQNSVERRIHQRKETLESEREKVTTKKEGKQEQKKDALNQYKENAVIAVNQRIQSVEQEIFVKKQELDGVRHQNEKMIIKAQKDGIVQLSSTLQKGDLIEPSQEIVSVIPTGDEKKVKILLEAQEVKGIKRGDKVQYAFKLKKTDKQMGTVTYVSAHPTFDKNSKTYMYELEATIDTQESSELHTGMIGIASVINGKEPIGKVIFRYLNLFSN